jgi:hypothetical protein
MRKERGLREASLAFLEGLVESCGPRDEMGALEFGTREDVIDFCLKRNDLGRKRR